MWIGLSIGMHAFPSNQDTKEFLKAVKEYKGKNLLWLLCLAFSLIIRLANLLRFFWFDLIYAIGISLLIPYLIDLLW